MGVSLLACPHHLAVCRSLHRPQVAVCHHSHSLLIECLLSLRTECHRLQACLSLLLAVCPSLHQLVCHSHLALLLVPAPLHLECPCRTTQDANRMVIGISTHAIHICRNKRHQEGIRKLSN